MPPLLTLTFNDWIYLGIVYAVFVLIAIWFLYGLFSAGAELYTTYKNRHRDAKKYHTARP